MEKFRVIVRSIGTVYAGGIERFAEEAYAKHLGGGHDVVLLNRGKIKAAAFTMTSVTSVSSGSDFILNRKAQSLRKPFN